MQAQSPAKLARQHLCLVKAARAAPLARQRHRHQQRIRRRIWGPGRSHQAPQLRSQRPVAAIFQRMDRQLQRATVKAGSKQPVHFQIMPAAKSTVCTGRQLQRQAALGAKRCLAQLHRRRTAGAKSVARNSACHAARRNEKVNTVPENFVEVDGSARSKLSRRKRGRKQRAHGNFVC